MSIRKNCAIVPIPSSGSQSSEGLFIGWCRNWNRELQDSTQKLILFETDCGKVRASLVAQMVKNMPAMQRMGSVPGLRISAAERTGNTLQYSSPENSVERGVWWATVHGVSKSCTQLRNYIFTSFHMGRSSLIVPSNYEKFCWKAVKRKLMTSFKLNHLQVSLSEKTRERHS